MTAQFQPPPSLSLSLSTVPPSDLMIIDCAMSPSSSAGESCLWQTIKPIGPSATSARATATYRPSDQATKRPPSHTDNDRVIALNPSIKRGHHDIVAPPAAKLPRLLPLLSKKHKKKRSQNWRRSLSTTSTTTFKFANCQVRSGNCNGATVAK